MVIDFAEIEKAWRMSIPVELDHSNLNDILGDQSTSERLAIYIAGKLRGRLAGLVCVEVKETDSTSAKVWP
jgi:6-pyruvoyl-tetrahydropterin synthase